MIDMLYLAACSVLAYTGFCRLVHTSTATVLCIRVVIWLLTVAALACGAAVLVWGYRPGWPGALLAACMAAVQVATSLLWRDGVPMPYQQDLQPAGTDLAELANVPHILIAEIDGGDGHGRAMVILPDGATTAALWVSEAHTGRRITAGIQLDRQHWRAVERAAGQVAARLPD